MRHIIRFDPSLQHKPSKPKKLKAKSTAIFNALENKILSMSEFLALCESDEVLGDLAICENSGEFLQSVGMDICFEEEGVYLGSLKRALREQEFCFVDIESTGADPRVSQILEIGAIKYRDGVVLGRFESYVRANEVPEIIEEITGITLEDVANAPSDREVLNEFREFLGQSIFVAHNVSFDYLYLDYYFWHLFGVGLYNQKLCTIELAKRSIASARYGLDFLNEFLEIHTPSLHRAYADAYTCMKIFEKCLQECKANFPTSQTLLNFSQKGKNLLDC